ncbi:caspase family protein, partial [Streptomyces sp. NPDC006655]|uniref:caspase family protein n=1 Tax=Streptomyces sp. NPDC006655 TaxID=3156898 RepID=UPI0034555316
MLVDEELGGWPDDQVTAIPDPVDCRRVMSDLRRHAQNTNGVLLLYFVGHGTVTTNGELVLAVSDTIADEPDVTGLEYSKIRSVLRDSPARVKAVVLDCCYSGRAIDVLAGDQQHLAVRFPRCAGRLTSRSGRFDVVSGSLVRSLPGRR